MVIEIVATYAALGLSILLAIERIVRASKDKSDQRVEKLRENLDTIQRFRDRVEGANVLDRLHAVEERQRADETALARVDERLQAIDRHLVDLCNEIRGGGV